MPRGLRYPAVSARRIPEAPTPRRGARIRRRCTDPPGTEQISTAVGGDGSPKAVTLQVGEAAQATLAWRNTTEAGVDDLVNVPYVRVRAKSGSDPVMVVPELDLGTTGKLGVGLWKIDETYRGADTDPARPTAAPPPRDRSPRRPCLCGRAAPARPSEGRARHQGLALTAPPVAGLVWLLDEVMEETTAAVAVVAVYVVVLIVLNGLFAHPRLPTWAKVTVFLTVPVAAVARLLVVSADYALKDPCSMRYGGVGVSKAFPPRWRTASTRTAAPTTSRPAPSSCSGSASSAVCCCSGPGCGRSRGTPGRSCGSSSRRTRPLPEPPWRTRPLWVCSPILTTCSPVPYDTSSTSAARVHRAERSVAVSDSGCGGRVLLPDAEANVRSRDPWLG